jgi:hypothetical protein
MTEAPYQLSYSIDLTTPTLISGVKGSSMLQETEPHIPGSVVWGAFAERYIQEFALAAGNAHADPGFRRMFLNGDVRFLSAYPSALDDDLVRLLPIPRSVFGVKGEPELAWDRTPDDADDPDESRSPVALNGFCVLRGTELHRQFPRTEISYHTRRDRAAGRTLSGQGPFAYEALSSGQRFRGLMLGAADDLAVVARLGANLRVGRSKSAEYGGIELRFDGDPRPFVSERASYDHARADTSASVLVLTLTSHLVASNAEPGFPVEQLARILGDQPERLRAGMRSFAAATWVGGYSGVWRMPRRQRPAIAAGSVFIFKGVASTPNDIESHSLGDRVTEGFGRFVVDWNCGQAQHIRGIEAQVPAKPEGRPPEEFGKLMAGAVSRRQLHDAVLDGQRDAAAIPAGKIPPNSVLARLQALLRESDFNEALGQISDLVASPDTKQINRTLRRFVSADGRAFDAMTRDWLSKDVSTVSAWKELARVSAETGLDLPSRSPEVARRYALTLLKELRRRRMQTDKGGRDA